jgi:hypothetical protein
MKRRCSSEVTYSLNCLQVVIEGFGTQTDGSRDKILPGLVEATISPEFVVTFNVSKSPEKSSVTSALVGMFRFEKCAATNSADMGSFVKRSTIARFS